MTYKHDFSGPGHLGPGHAALLWLAQGFGMGRVPGLPGTLGSILGVGWAVILMTPRNLGIYLIGTSVGLILSVYVCHVAEKLLQQEDPGSVVMDEITALPVCFLGWVLFEVARSKPPFDAISFSEPTTWGWLVIGFVAFRAFDIAKPWPVRQSQYLGGGLGVTIDDLLAAVYVNLVTLPIGIWWHQ